MTMVFLIVLKLSRHGSLFALSIVWLLLRRQDARAHQPDKTTHHASILDVFAFARAIYYQKKSSAVCR